jgi:DNA-directed RNA polymerase specialized sigma24 family protein
MADAADGSVTRWIGALKAGDDSAGQLLWERYYGQLVRIARDRLRAAPRAVADEEDATLSAFDSFLAGVRRGRFPRLDDRHDLWRVLVTLTDRKAVNQARHATRQKRGGGASVVGDDLERIAAAGPTAEFAAMVAEEFGRRLDALSDPTLRRVAVWKLEGYENVEIADLLACGVRTVERKLELIRKLWLAEAS